MFDAVWSFMWLQTQSHVCVVFFSSFFFPLQTCRWSISLWSPSLFSRATLWNSTAQPRPTLLLPSTGEIINASHAVRAALTSHKLTKHPRGRKKNPQESYFQPARRNAGKTEILIESWRLRTLKRAEQKTLPARGNVKEMRFLGSRWGRSLSCSSGSRPASAPASARRARLQKALTDLWSHRRPWTLNIHQRVGAGRQNVRDIWWSCQRLQLFWD